MGSCLQGSQGEATTAVATVKITIDAAQNATQGGPPNVCVCVCVCVGFGFNGLAAFPLLGIAIRGILGADYM